jgi:hypothetical protein
MLRQIVANTHRTGLNIIGAGVHLNVVKTVGVGELRLSGSYADDTVATSSFSLRQDIVITVHADKDDVDVCHDGQQISEPPRLTEDVIHHDVVPSQRHCANCAMKSSAGATQHLDQTRLIEIMRLRFGAHRPEHVHTHVKPRRVEVSEKLTGQRGLT